MAPISRVPLNLSRAAQWATETFGGRKYTFVVLRPQVCGAEYSRDGCDQK